MIPYAPYTLHQFIPDLLAILDNIIGIATQFDPPVAGGGVVIVGQLAAAGLLLGVNASVAGVEDHAGGMGTDGQILFGEMVGPVGRNEFHRLAHVQHEDFAVVGDIQVRGRVQRADAHQVGVQHRRGFIGHGGGDGLAVAVIGVTGVGGFRGGGGSTGGGGAGGKF